MTINKAPSLSMRAIADILLNYLPGFIILIFGMLALHSSLHVMIKHENLARHYNHTSEKIITLQKKYETVSDAYMSYLKKDRGAALVALEKSFDEFMIFYNDELSSETFSYTPEINERLQKILYEIGNDLMIQAELIKDLNSAKAGPFNISKSMNSVHALEHKIASMWEILHASGSTASLYERLKYREKILYWSVIAIGFAGFVLVMLNSYRLRQLKTAAREKQDYLKLLQDRFVAMESTSDGIGIINKDGDLTYMNDALARLHGISSANKQEYINQSWTYLYGEEGRQEISEHVMPVLLERGYWRGEKLVKKTDGEVIHAELSLTSLIDGGFIGTARDITERYRVEKEKEELQSQFYQAQKMEAIGRLAGGIAHDFNNILAAMNGYAEFLTDDLEEGSAQHKFAKNILQAGLQARGLVDQMLAFSRIKESEIGSMDILVSLHETLSMIDASFSKTIEVMTHINLDHANIYGNETQISQVIMNLCVNAKDAMGDEHGELSIHIDRVNSVDYKDIIVAENDLPDAQDIAPAKIEDLEPGRTRLVLSTMKEDVPYVRLKISDTGSGMSRVVMEHVFEPFFTTKSVEEGTGLGLSTVHGVVIEHQAAMIIDSKLGEGTTFEILFPEANQVRSKQVVDEKKSIDLSGFNILLVEDQKDVREMMADMLARAGIEAELATNGIEALELIRESFDDFDLVITDQNMPKMTGYEIVQQAYLDFPDLPFVLLSGYSEEKLQDLMQDHPAIKAILRKPVSQKVLRACLSEILSESE